MQLVAHHREIAMTTALAGYDERGLLASMRFDSCGIWLVGGVFRVRTLSVDFQCIAGAMHLALLHLAKDKFKQYTRGYPLTAYAKPSEADFSYHRAREVPSSQAVDQVLACWRFHQMEPVQANLWQWQMHPSEHASEEWVHCANCLPTTGEQMEALWFLCVGPWASDFQSRSPLKRVRANVLALARLPFAPRPEAILTGLGVEKSKTAIQDALLEEEERFYDQGWVSRDGRGGTAQRRPGATALAGVATSGGARIGEELCGLVTEVLPDFQMWDSHGYIWGRPGHYPLWVMLGPGRHRSDDGARERDIKNTKILQWKAGGNWPWWVRHESEVFYWLPGHRSSGRGFSGFCVSRFWPRSSIGVGLSARPMGQAVWLVAHETCPLELRV